MNDFLAQLAQIIGIQYVLTDHEDKAPYLTDWRKRYTGKALAVVLPRTTLEIAQIVSLCSSKGVSIVPQGGHTGFCGGATPDASGNQIVLNFKRMNSILEIDAENQTITVEAGCILQNVQ